MTMGKRKLLRSNFKQTVVPWAFLLPHFLGVLCFALLPMLQVLAGSFQSAVGGKWRGIRNYLAVLNNAAFRTAVSNTARFIVVCVPILVVLSLALAVALSAVPRVGGVLRSTSLMPMAVPAASLVLVWKVLFHKKGFINAALLALGGSGVDWMDSGAAFWMLVISYLWKNMGYTMVLWTAGLAGVPENVYEAAQWPDARRRQELKQWVDGLTTPALTDRIIRSMVMEQMDACLNGRITAQEAAQAALRSLNLYLSE